jgi:hypothetical protein
MPLGMAVFDPSFQDLRRRRSGTPRVEKTFSRDQVMRLLRMTTRRWMLAVAAAGVMTWGTHRDGFLALAWEAPLLGSSLGILVAREKQRRLAGSVLGGAVAGTCVWFVNFFLYQQYTGVTVFAMPNEPFTEAMGGALGGAVVGLLVAGIASIPAALAAVARFTVRDWMIVVAISALILAGIICFIRSPFQERLVMVGVAVFVGLPCLVAIGWRERPSAR